MPAAPTAALPFALLRRLARLAALLLGGLLAAAPAAGADPRPAAVSATVTVLPTGLPRSGSLGPVAIDADSNEVYVLQGSAGRLARLNVEGSSAAMLAVPAGADLFAPDPARAQVLVTEGRRLHFIALPTAAGSAPEAGAAVDGKTAPKAVAAAAEPAASLPLPGPILALVVDAANARALVLTHGQSNLHLIDTAGRRLLDSHRMPQADQLVLDAPRGLLWILSGPDQLLAWDLARQTVVQQRSLPCKPDQLAIDPGLGQLAVTCGQPRPQLLRVSIDDALARGPLASGALSTTDLPAVPGSLAIDTERHLALVSLPKADQLGVLDLASGRWYGAYVRVDRPGEIAIAPMRGQAVVLSNAESLLRFDLPQPVPEITAVNPAQAPAGSPALTLQFEGRGFTRDSRVAFGPLALTTRYITATRLEAELPATALAYPGNVQLTVTNPKPGGGSAKLAFTVRAFAPELLSLAPAQLVANSQPAALQLLGRQFQRGARLLAGEHLLATDWQSATALGVVLPGTLLQTAGQLSLQVVNPDGQRSAPLFLVLAAPPPALAIDRIVPPSAAPGARVTLEGRGFDPVAAGQQVTLAGQPLPILAASPTALTVQVPDDASSGPVMLIQPRGSAIGPWFEVLREQDFALTASPGQLTLQPGARSTVTLQLASRGTRSFEGLVDLAVPGLPDTVTAELSRPVLGLAQPVTLRLTARAGTAPASVAAEVIATARIGGVVLSRRAPLRLAIAAADPAARAVQGRFVTPDGRGVAGVRVRADLGDDAGLLSAPNTVSDAGGNFLLAGLPPGELTLRMDATPAHPLYPIWPLSVTLPEQGVLSLADWTLQPPPLAERYTPIANAARDQAVTDERYPGFAVVLPAGVSITGWDGVPKQRIAIERLSPDQLPVPAPPFAMKEAYQLHFGSAMGGIPSAPIPVTLPNVAELAPGEQAEIWWFDGSPMGGSGEWKLAGLGTVSPDGRTVAANPGVGIPRFCGVCGLVSLNCPPPPTPPQPPPMPDPPACGNPIDLYTGQSLATASGLACGGRTPITTDLRYHPVDAFNNRAGTIASAGYGWVLEADIAFLPFAGPQKRLVLPGSRFIHFIDDGSGQYQVPDDARFAGAIATEIDANGPRWQIRFIDGTRWTFEPFAGTSGLIRGGPPLFLTAITDAAGATQSFTRQPNGRLTVIGSPNRQVRFSYGAHGFVEQITDDAGRRQRFTYNALGRIATLTDADDRTTAFSYAGDDEIAPDPVCGAQPDGGQRLIRIDYPGKSTATLNDYGVGRRVLRQRGASGLVYRFDYQLSGACVTHVARPGQRCVGAHCPSVDSWEHHQAGWRLHGGRVLATTVTHPDGTRSTTRFNARGLPVETLDALGQRSSRDYDAAGRLVAETDALGRRWRHTYDEQGRRLSSTDPLGRRTEFGYDQRWPTPLTIMQTLDDGRRLVTRQQLHPQHGQLLRVQDAMGRITSFEYDEHGQLQAIEAPLGRRWRFGRNAVGDLTRITDPLARRTVLGTDAVGRVTTITDALGTTQSLAYAGGQTPVVATDALGRRVRIGQDAAGRLASITNAAGVTLDTRRHDDGDRLVEQTDALGAATRSTYDSAGRLITRTDRNGHVTRFSYDVAGRLIALDDGVQRQTRRHDAAGRLIELQQVDAGGSQHTQSFQYDAADRVTVVETQSLGLTSRVRIAYDTLDRRTERRVTINGGPEQLTRYQWNDAGQLTLLEAGEQRSRFRYDAAGRLIHQSLPNGLIKTLAWDAADQLTRLTYTTTGGHVLEDVRYAYDAAGRRIKKESLGPTLRETPMTATYDAANRMTTLVLQPGTAQERRYALTQDAAGQLTEKVRVDAQGQPTTGLWAARSSYTWNRRGELVELVSRDGDKTVTSGYRYDALGGRVERRIEVQDDETAPARVQTVRYVYDGLQAIAEVRDGAGLDQPQTTHLLTGLQLDELIARHTTQSLQVALTDALGSVLAITDASGQVTGSWAYSPYGETVAVGPNLEQPNQYTGREHDEGASAEPGSAQQVYYYRARYYAPGAKRFLSEDPIGVAGGINVYGYVGGDPVSYSDPSGLVLFNPVTIGAAIGGVAGAIQAANASGGWTPANAGSISMGALTGMVAGAIPGLVPARAGLAAATITGGSAGAAGNIAGQMSGGTSFACIDWVQAGTQGAVGAVGGAVGYGAGLGSALGAVRSGSGVQSSLRTGEAVGAVAGGSAVVHGNLPIPTSHGGFRPSSPNAPRCGCQ